MGLEETSSFIGTMLGRIIGIGIKVMLIACCVVFGNYLSREWLAKEPCKCKCECNGK